MAERLRLSLGAAAVEWELDALMRAADAPDPEAPPAWELQGDVDWSATESVRVIFGTAGETAIAIAVARPAGAESHDADLVAAVTLGPAGPDAADEAMLSTEYDAEGAVRRVGIELWPAAGMARRIAADRSGTTAVNADGPLRRESTPLAVRLDGTSGSGLHELVRPA